jgi:hypothetical protein
MYSNFKQYFLKEEIIQTELFADILRSYDPALYNNYIDKLNSVRGTISKGIRNDNNLWAKEKYRNRIKAETGTNIKFKIKIVYIDLDLMKLLDLFQTSAVGLFRDHLDVIIPPTPGVITVVLNSSAVESDEDFMRLDPKGGGAFMLGHKIGHAADSVYASQARGGIGLHAKEKIAKIEHDIRELMYRSPLTPEIGGLPLSHISNLKSVQSGRMTSLTEFVYDLVGQYVRFGRVTFRPLAPRLEQYAEQLVQFSAYITKQIEDILSIYVGHNIYDII